MSTTGIKPDGYSIEFSDNVVSGIDLILFDRAYELRARFVPDESGGFVAYAITLPGVVSQGDTREEAIKNICDAFQGAMLSYMESGKEIPWQEEQGEDKEDLKTPGVFDLWLQVDLDA